MILNDCQTDSILGYMKLVSVASVYTRTLDKSIPTLGHLGFSLIFYSVGLPSWKLEKPDNNYCYVGSVNSFVISGDASLLCITISYIIKLTNQAV